MSPLRVYWRTAYCSAGQYMQPLLYVLLQQRMLTAFSSADSYSYEVTVKACHKTDSSIALASFCSEPSCNATIGDVIQRDLPVNTDNAWATTQVRIGFNPVAMKLTGLTDEWLVRLLSPFAIVGATWSIQIGIVVGNGGSASYGYRTCVVIVSCSSSCCIAVPCLLRI